MPTVAQLMQAWGMERDVSELNLQAYLSGGDWDGSASNALPGNQELSAQLRSNEDDIELLQDLHDSIAQSDAPRLPELQVPAGGALAQAELLFEAGYSQLAVELLCAGDGWVLQVPPRERRLQSGALPPALARRAQRLLQICGMVLLQGSMPEDAMQRIQRRLDSSPTQAQVAAHGVNSTAAVGSMPLDVLADDAVALNPWVMPTVSGGMRSSRLELGAAAVLPQQAAQHQSSGILLARDQHVRPGTLDGFAHSLVQQRLHAAYPEGVEDATCRDRARAMSHPRHGFWSGMSTTPAVGVHVLLPLGGAGDRRRVMTYATAGSHMQCMADMCAMDDDGKCPHEGSSMMEVRMGPGDALLVDSRLHLAPLLPRWMTLALTVNQEWFKSPHLSKTLKHTSVFASLPADLRSLFGRVDALQGAQLARAQLQAMFVDVDEMESQYVFDAYDYDESSFFADMELSALQYQRKMDPVIAGYRQRSSLLEQEDSNSTPPTSPHMQLL